MGTAELVGRRERIFGKVEHADAFLQAFEQTLEEFH